MRAGIYPQTRCNPIKRHTYKRAHIVKRNLDADPAPAEIWWIAGTVNEKGNAGPGFWQPGLRALRNVLYFQRTLTAHLVRC